MADAQKIIKRQQTYAQLGILYFAIFIEYFLKKFELL